MRINGYNGIVKWTTVVSIKDNYNPYTIKAKSINTEDSIFVEISQLDNLFILRINSNGVAFQMIGFQKKSLNSLFKYSEAIELSTKSFMFHYLTDKIQYGMSVSETSGIDKAFMVGNYDLTSNYTLMIDYNSDYPYYTILNCDTQY